MVNGVARPYITQRTYVHDSAVFCVRVEHGPDGGRRAGVPCTSYSKQLVASIGIAVQAAIGLY